MEKWYPPYLVLLQMYRNLYISHHLEKVHFNSIIGDILHLSSIIGDILIVIVIKNAHMPALKSSKGKN